MRALFHQMGEEAANAEIEPDWRTPNAFYITEAKQFVRDYAEHGVDLDEAVAIQLLKLDYEGDFRAYRRWFEGNRCLVIPPQRTCEGMTEAGQALAEAIDRGDKIAVYCDYDVDGTTAGEAFRRGLQPYGADLHYGYADAQQGFGLTNDFVQEAADAGAKVLVTLDCGTGQIDQVKMAQDLGMQVVVVDHHDVNHDNTAEFHLNPKLVAHPDPDKLMPPSSENTGAQLAWKLAASVQQAKEGKTRDEHWEEPLKLAGMGALADMGSVLIPENRAFFWSAAENVPAGVQALAERLEEDPTTPGSMVLTQACMNLPKRTPKVSAADVGALLAAETAEDAAPIVDKLVSSYEEAKPVRLEMVEEALKQVGGKAEYQDDGSIERPDPDKRVTFVKFDEKFSDYSGYTGPVASNISRATQKPAFALAYKGKDDLGQELYKFSSRNDSGVRHELGELTKRPDFLEACTIKKIDESGAVKEGPVAGGHDQVVSGSCRAENVDKLIAAVEGWAEAKAGSKGTQWWPRPWDGPEANIAERNVAPERLANIEEQAKQLGPFSKQRAMTEQPRQGRAPKVARHKEMEISVRGQLEDLKVDPENDKWLVGTLKLSDDVSRTVRYPADVDDRPEGEQCEWILKVGRGTEYYLRKFHRPGRKASDSQPAAAA